MTENADALSRLLTLYPVRTSLEVRCHFGAPWQLPVPAVLKGVAPYHIIMSGQAQLALAGHSALALQAGDIVVLPQGQAHALQAGSGKLEPHLTAPKHDNELLIRKENAGSGPHTDILCGQFHFAAAATAVLLPSLPAVMLVRTAGRTDFAGLHTLMAMLRMETEQMRPGAHEVVSQLSSALLALLLRAWMEQEQAHAMPGLLTLLASPRLRAALHCMLSEPGRAWSLEQLAAVCHLSRTTFARLFRAAAGMTAGEVLTRTRMAHAAALLAGGQRSVAGVAEAVGYQSEASFNRIFKRHFQIGPGQYRRQEGG